MCVNAGQLDINKLADVTSSTWGSDNYTYGMYYTGEADNVREALNALLDATGGTADTDFNYFSGGANVGTGNAAASNVYYWSSSEWSSAHAFSLDFYGDGNLGFSRYYGKSTATFRVRPVLAF